MRRFSLWMRAHPMVGDSLIAVLLLLIDVAVLLATNLGPEPEPPPAKVSVALPLSALAVLPLIVRRRYPLVSAYGVLVLGAAHAALQVGLSSGIASAISVYSVVVYAGRGHGVLYLLLMVAVSDTQILLQYDNNVVNAVVATLTLALCWMLGEFVGARRAYHAEVEARLHLLETERDQATRIAVAEERGRIARELHDVVAHAVSVIVVHADGASYAIRSDPGTAERAVRTISETGRSALAELRRLLEVLRGEATGGEPRVPQPTASDLAEVADAMRAAGLPVRLDVDGDLGELPAGVSLGVYRIVQESLTNALKHAGPGATARVCVRRGDDEVTVTVTDDGAGRAREVSGARQPAPGGNGLIGMRERAHVYGGTLDAGPSPGGGWHVRVRLPVRLEP